MKRLYYFHLGLWHVTAETFYTLFDNTEKGRKHHEAFNRTMRWFDA